MCVICMRELNHNKFYVYVCVFATIEKLVRLLRNRKTTEDEQISHKNQRKKRADRFGSRKTIV